MSTDNAYAAEIAFVNRKLFNNKVKWEALPAKSEIISPPLSESEAKNVVSSLKDAFSKKALVVFNKMVFTVSSKLRGGTRVVVSINLLREFFGGEIDGDFGGGGKSYNPYSNQPKPPGGRGV